MKREESTGTLKDGPFPWLQAWCRYLDSAAYWIESEVKRAREDKAPVDCLYKRASGWRTIRDLDPSNPFFAFARERFGLERAP